MKLSPVLQLPQSAPQRGASRPARRVYGDEAFRRTGLHLRDRDPVHIGASTPPVRAVAVAHERCNAVGTVELSCGPKGLHIRFVRIVPFSDGYVPYPSATGHAITAPYDQVVRAVTDSSGLVHLTLDPACTPFNKLVLAGLVREHKFDHHSSFLRRARIESVVTLAAIALWMPLAWTLRALVSSMSEALVLAVSATAAMLVHAMRRDIASRLVLFGSKSERIRSELLADLALRLGPERVRNAPAADAAASAQPDRVPERDSAESSGLRSLFATAGIVAAVALVAILVSKSLLSISLSPQEARLRDIEAAEESTPAAVASASPSNAPAGSITPEPPKPAKVLPPCSCDRADSVLWAGGVPQLAILATTRPGKTSAKRPRIYPEIAVVNNGNQDLKNVILTVDFLLGAHDGKPAHRAGEEGLLYDGTLGPGQAIKWRVKGKGDDYVVTSSITGKVGEAGLAPAPADAFHKLLTAHTPSVRLHGAKMLAYLGDPRAREAIEQLEKEHREEMASTLSLLADAVRSMRVCSVRAVSNASPGHVNVEACVFNASNETRDRPAVVVRTLQGSTTQESRWIVEASIAPGSGVRTTGTIEGVAGENQPAASSLQLVAEP
ncbi:MAG: hypothetical protein HY898_22370 [Deltaproteobacteria bacterium]|nr:hypothetical protein [Deltaproteobacteria bacterium]